MDPLTAPSWMYGRVVSRMHDALDVRAHRQAVISENLANVSTPGFQSRDVRFADSMKRARQLAPETVRVTHSRHLRPSDWSPNVVYQTDAEVDIVRDMTRLASNRGAYQEVATMMRSRLRALLAAASDGRAGMS